MANLDEFRAEVSAWLKENAPKALLGKRRDPLAETQGGGAGLSEKEALVIRTEPAAPAAKARCSDALILIANEAVQFFGGIGMTDEHDVGFFMTRARVCDLTFGDSAFHRDRWAGLNGL